MEALHQARIKIKCALHSGGVTCSWTNKQRLVLCAPLYKIIMTLKATLKNYSKSIMASLNIGDATSDVSDNNRIMEDPEHEIEISPEGLPLW